MKEWIEILQLPVIFFFIISDIQLSRIKCHWGKSLRESKENHLEKEMIK